MIERDLEQRVIKGSVREIAAFSLYPHASKNAKALQWRAEIGTHWHQTLRLRASEDTETKAEFEITVDGQFEVLRWGFQIRGRIDQIIHDDKVIRIREIKTVNLPLPQPETDLRNQYPEYFRQASLYERLFRNTIPLNQETENAVVFVDINTGISQTITTTASDEEDLEDHLALIVDHFENQKKRLKKLRQLKLKPPFDNWREGQEAVRQQLAKDISQHKTILFQAPTGFGKTGLILEATLKQIQEGHASRIFFLTGKTTGQLPIRQQLETIGGNNSGLRHFVIRNQQDLGVDSFHQFEEGSAIDKLRSIETRWKESGIQIESLFQKGTISLEDLIALSNELSIPARNLNTFLLPYTEIWIGDYNYLFDPSVRKNFTESVNYNPKETILIIDEAHNLPSRTTSSWSWTIKADEVKKILTDIHFAKFSDKLTRSIDIFLSWLTRTPPKDELNPPEEADLFEYLTEIERNWKSSFLTSEDLSPESQEWLWELNQRIETFSSGLPYHTYIPQKGEVRRECLNASSWIAPIIKEHAQSILMSATLHPFSSFAQSIGLSQSDGSAKLIAQAPWQEHAFEIIVDKRVDTRYTQRERSYATTARTILQVAELESDPMVVFFPSYRYAETISNYLKVQNPYLKLSTQPRTASLEEQEFFLEQSLLFSDVIFLILGSRFSEGIDSLGGRVKLAMIVGPALPEVNPI